MNRREFARLATLTAAAATTLTAATPTPSKKAPVRPKALAAGDTVGLVLPATAASTMDEIAFAKEQLETIGFKVLLGKHVYDRWGYFAGGGVSRRKVPASISLTTSAISAASLTVSK